MAPHTTVSITATEAMAVTGTDHHCFANASMAGRFADLSRKQGFIAVVHACSCEMLAGN